jgi:hypothetical protein
MMGELRRLTVGLCGLGERHIHRGGGGRGRVMGYTYNDGDIQDHIGDIGGFGRPFRID